MTKRTTIYFLAGALSLASSLPAHALGINAPPSESGDSCKSAGDGVQACRTVINQITGRFENRDLTITYQGPLLKDDSTRISMYLSLNGEQTENGGPGRAVPMQCSRVDASLSNEEGTLSCSFYADSFQSSTYLFASAASGQAWTLELAFADQNGQWDSNGGRNYEIDFPAATEGSSATEYFDYGSSLAYDAATNTITATYVPGNGMGNPALSAATHAGEGIMMGALINGQPLPVTHLTVDPSGYQFIGKLSLQGVSDGNLQVYFYDAQGNYDSAYGQNYSFTLRRK